MRYGIAWYKGVGEHDYKEFARDEYVTMKDLFVGMLNTSAAFCGPDEVFAAMVDGCEEAVYWIRDDLGFEFYRP